MLTQTASLSKSVSTNAGAGSAPLRLDGYRTRHPKNMLNQSTAGGASLMDRVRDGNVVRDFKIGNTRIKICDDCCRDKTTEQVDAILMRVAHLAQESLSTQNIE